MKQHSLKSMTRSALGLMLATLLGSAAAQAPVAGPTVASLGSVAIAQSEVERLLQGLPEAQRNALKSQPAGLQDWLQQRVASEALLREAQQKQWAERPEVKARIDAAQREIRERIVSSSYLDAVTQLPADFPSAAQLQAAYEQAKPQLQLPATYQVAQIFLASATNADAPAIAALRAKAVELATQARSGDFAALAKAHSQDPRSAAQGGDVGALPLAQMLPEMREPVTRLKPGQVSEPLQSAAGFHVLKLLAVQPARVATLAEAGPRLQAALRTQRRQELANAVFARLAPAGSIRIDSAALDAVLQKFN